MKDYTQRIEASPMDTPTVQPIYINSGGTATVIIVMFLFSVLIMGLVYRDSASAITGILASVPVFLVGTPVLVLAVRGDIARIVCDYQAEITTRLLHEQQYTAQADLARLRVVDPTPLPYTEPAQAMQLAERTTFVAPHADTDDSAKREAAAWILQLYGADGNPDPKKVLMQSDKERPGRVRIAAPSRPAKQYLLDKNIIHDLGTGFRLNLVRCPTIELAQNQLM